MPSKALRFCSWPGCNELARGAYCDKHQHMADEKRAKDKARYSRTRDTTTDRGYDAAWQKCRAAYLAAHPLCEMCKSKGRVVPAELVHHIRPLSEGGKRLDPANLTALCNACHEAIHGPDRWRRRDAGGKG